MACILSNRSTKAFYSPVECILPQKCTLKWFSQIIVVLTALFLDYFICILTYAEMVHAEVTTQEWNVDNQTRIFGILKLFFGNMAIN